MAGLPAAILFACTFNTVRSPMAAALMRHFHGHRVYVDSAGLRAGETDPYVTLVMDEIGIDLARHRAKSFEDLDDNSFDLIVSLSPEAHHGALELTRTMACEVEYWPTFDPTAVEGSRDATLDAYRGVRDMLMKRIRQRFKPSGGAAV
jgi:protein-tyrosine-phosphatase